MQDVRNNDKDEEQSGATNIQINNITTEDSNRDKHLDKVLRGVKKWSVTNVGIVLKTLITLASTVAIFWAIVNVLWFMTQYLQSFWQLNQ